MTTLDGKQERLQQIVRDLGSVVIAYSGGVDSTLLAKVCHDVLGRKALAVTARSETYPEHEFHEAKKNAALIGIEHLVIETCELGIEGFANNPPNRCYYCKSELFRKLRTVADERGFKHVADGANVDDTGDFRPGLTAAKELGVRSPLKEAGLTKQDVRELSKALGLPTWDKPSYACMSSRFPYGQTITPEKLSMVAQAEEFLRGLGLRQFRVRHHDTIARIEVLPADLSRLANGGLRTEIIRRFKEIGYAYVTLDLEGYRTGSMNEVLPEAVKVQGVKQGSDRISNQ